MPAPTMDEWRAMSDAQRVASAEDVARAVGPEARFCGLRGFGATDAPPIAVMLRGGHEFVFVPGGDVVVGFDPDGWAPLDHELEEEGEDGATLEEIVARTVRGARRVRVASMLVEVCPWDVAWTPIDDVEGALTRIAPHTRFVPDWRAWNGPEERVIRVEIGGDPCVADRREPVVFSDLEGRLGADGFRLPTADEWEYLCGAGVKTLFRWGDHCPDGPVSSPVNVDLTLLRRDVHLLGAEPLLKLESERWGIHRRRNAFGLVIAFDPGAGELLADARFRGGDGGMFACGGAGALLTWLPLASSFVPPGDVRLLGSVDREYDDVVARRVRSV